MGLSVWASREERIAHRHLEGYRAPGLLPFQGKNLLLPELDSVGFYVTFFWANFIIFLHWQNLFSQSEFQADVFSHIFTD